MIPNTNMSLDTPAARVRKEVVVVFEDFLLTREGSMLRQERINSLRPRSNRINVQSCSVTS